MEMFPVCEITRSQGIERVIYNHGVLSCKSPPAMARQSQEHFRLFIGCRKCGSVLHDTALVFSRSFPEIQM